VGEALLGQVIDSLGASYEDGFRKPLPDKVSLYGVSSNPMKRALIREPLDLGVRSVNACLTCGKGQRQGIFAGSGVGKSVLLGMMARYTKADVVVIGLIGERGREVKEFIEDELGAEGRKKSVIIVETADKSPVRRARGAYAAAAVSEYFRDRGANVLLLMDSLTRFAMAQREIGMAAGEPPTTKGYTPSVFTSLSRLVERAGNWGTGGSITGLYTVLVEGDDMEDPVADNARAILDGHIVLSRKLANRGHYPAIDVLASVSRVMDHVTDKEHRQKARLLKQSLARYQENEDAIQYGMYQRGSDLDLDACIQKEPLINRFLNQDRDERASLADSSLGLSQLFEGE
jgi:flagellum-specific ATP synthase